MADINTAEFMRAFDKMVERTEQNADQAFRAMCLQLFSGIVVRTPVKTGRLIGNWQIGIDQPETGELDRTGDPSDSELPKLNQISGYSVVYYTNNLPYAERIEFDGWSKIKAPAGMVRVTLTEFESALRKAAQDNKL